MNMQLFPLKFVSINTHYNIQVAALENHRPHAEKCFDNVDAKASVLLSEVDALEFTSFLEEQKHQAQPIEVDVRDAKRRITVAKGPKKKTPQPPVESEAESE